MELVRLWEKMNYLAGLTYPEWAAAVGGGLGMIAPMCKLTIGQMYTNTPGYISALTYTVQDNGTWEIDAPENLSGEVPEYVEHKVLIPIFDFSELLSKLNTDFEGKDCLIKIDSVSITHADLNGLGI